MWVEGNKGSLSRLFSRFELSFLGNILSEEARETRHYRPYTLSPCGRGWG